MFLTRSSFLGIQFVLLILINNYSLFVDAQHRGRSKEVNMVHVRYEDFQNQVTKLNKGIEGTRQQADTNSKSISDIKRFLPKLEEKISKFRNILKQFQKMLPECSVNKIAKDLSNSDRGSERIVEDVQEREREFEMILGQSLEVEDSNCLVKISRTLFELKRKLKDEQLHRQSLEDRILAMEAKMKDTRSELQMVKRKAEENGSGLLNLLDDVNVKNTAVQKTFHEMRNGIRSRLTVIEEKLKNSDDKLNDCDTTNACLLLESTRNATLKINPKKRFSEILNEKFRVLERHLTETQIFSQATREMAMENDQRIINLFKKSNEDSTDVTAGLNGSVIEEKLKELETKFLDCDSFSECLLSTYPGKVASTGNSSFLTKNPFFTEEVLTCRQERNEMQDILENDNSSAMSTHFNGIFDDLGSCLFSINLLKAFKMQNETLHSDLFTINFEIKKIIEELPTLRAFDEVLASKYKEMNRKVQYMASNMSAFFEGARTFREAVNNQIRSLMAAKPTSHASLKTIGKNYRNIVQASDREEYLNSRRSEAIRDSIYPAKPVNES